MFAELVVCVREGQFWFSPWDGSDRVGSGQVVKNCPMSICVVVFLVVVDVVVSLQCFDAVSWTAGREGIRLVKTEW